MTHVPARALVANLHEFGHTVTTTQLRRLVCSRHVDGYRGGLDWMVDFSSFREFIDRGDRP
ncbi:hypothetical protein QM787_04345 [Rhodococcus ruber]|uniref:hypothetical protein n=1 Tax=Rhodococcus TaxID=1827 RepID=UPI00058BFA96|nr:MULTISPECIES: hypothetical protein [Rhodococcus]MCD2127731.1 hypothetical protein [Rhodococcus ruber]MCZ1071685.1 hypothetical protein [Rhodococcus sp. A5(2022)]MCZ4504389.1 hypothetical protein [Rhodococcus ruber]MCZ4529375.1 hypothetical protein [Rhodococcus ruber]MCZ4621050.1 hypothetical protein [Rhodococcus ruber]